MRRCLIHVGAPKTGTTYLQYVLWRNQQTLAQRGLLFPGSRGSDHHDAALDLRGVSFGAGTQTDPVSAWDRLVREADGWDGDTVISSELLAWATPAQSRRAVESLPDHELHVLFTARDLTRQVPAVWQEEIKNRRVIAYDKFLSQLETGDDNHRGPGNLWGGQDPRHVLGSWGAHLPAEHVHVVTVPPKGAPGDVLLQRFFSVLGVSYQGLDLSSGEANVGLGPHQVELLRHVNRRLGEEFTWRSYDHLVKYGIAVGPLAEGQRVRKVTLPEETYPIVAARTTRMLAAVRDAGYDVVGDLDDLVVRTPDSFPATDPQTTAEVLREAGAATIADLLRRLAATEERVHSLTDQLAGASGAPSGAPPVGEPVAEPVGEPVGEPVASAVVLPAAAPRHDPRSGEHTAFVFLGPPKAGLDHLQRLLADNHQALTEQGVWVAGDADETRSAAGGLADPRFTGVASLAGEVTWEDLAARVRDKAGTWLIAHDILVAADAKQARAAVEALAPATVHLVLVARAIDRQLPAEWVEQLRNGSDQPFEHFLTMHQRDGDMSPHYTWFWQAQDLVEVLGRWAADVPPERVHVITSPRGADSTPTAWRRLCAVLGVDPALLTVPDDIAPLEPSPADAEVLRLLNVVLRRRDWSWREGQRTELYERAVRRRLVDSRLAVHQEGSQLVPPAELQPWMQGRTQALSDTIKTAGYDVVGDVTDLEPAPPRADQLQPGRILDQHLLEAAVRLVAAAAERLATGPDAMGVRALTRHLARKVRAGVRDRIRRRL